MWYIALKFFIFIVLMILLSMFSTYTFLGPYYVILIPNLLLCALFYNLLYVPMMNVYIIFMVGLLQDFLTNSVFGWHILLFLLIYYYVSFRRDQLIRQSFINLWVQFIVIAFIYNMLTLLFYPWSLFILLSMVLGWIITSLAYPICAIILRNIFQLLRI